VSGSEHRGANHGNVPEPTAGMRPGVRVGIDVGSVRVGVATCDPSGFLATPVETISRDANDQAPGALPADILQVVAHVRRLEAIEVIVGLPRSLSGAEGPAARAARAYAEQVARAIDPVPVRLVDERLSTVSAHRSLHAAGRPGRRHRSVVDQVAAVTILQAALDGERGRSAPPGEPVVGRDS
jgi:putative Holliday junction resolvase